MLYICGLILLGILFLVAELVFLPGLSVAALLSAVCYGLAIYFAFVDYDTTTGFITIGVAMASVLATIIISLRAKTWQRLSLTQEIDSTSVAKPEERIAIGATGVTISRLSPMGKVEIDGHNYEAKSADVYIEQRQRVVVVGFDNFSVIVKQCE